MSVIKLTEPYAVTFLRNQVRDSLVYHGEEAVLLTMFREKDHVARCSRCTNDAYDVGEFDCPVCYGTSFQGGVKDARRVWCIFNDHTVSEQYGQYGTLTPDQRMVQTEAFPLLIEHDWIVRIKRWDANHTVLKIGGYWSVDAVTRQSLRTGSQFGQTPEDVIGQAAQCSWYPPGTQTAIFDYPILNQTFPEFTITGTPTPTVIHEPDTRVIYIPVPDGSAPPPDTGFVIGAQVRWNPVFTYTQTAPSRQWVIDHTLDHDPEVTVIVDDEVVDADVTYPDGTTVLISFEDPQTGIAELV